MFIHIILLIIYIGHGQSRGGWIKRGGAEGKGGKEDILLYSMIELNLLRVIYRYQFKEG